MSNTSDIINLIRDVVNPIGLKVWKFSHPIDQEGKERIVLNSIPNNQVRAGSFKQNNDVVNINIFVPKINGSPDSARIETLDNLVQNALESFSGTTTRVGYYYLDPQPSQTFNESDKETLTNIRIEVTYT